MRFVKAMAATLQENTAKINTRIVVKSHALDIYRDAAAGFCEFKWFNFISMRENSPKKTS